MTATATRAAFRPFDVVVADAFQLTTHFRRVTFTGPELATIGSDGADQRIKLILPREDGTIPDLGTGSDWYQRWRALPDTERNPIRTYTIRAFNPERAELTVDFAIHTPAGPATQWALTASPGDRLVIVGPDALSDQRGIGLDFHPGSARDILLVGDETALPAIAAILASRPCADHVHVFVETPTGDDVLPLDEHANVHLSWQARGTLPYGATLIDRVVRFARQRHHLFGATRPQQIDDVDVDHELLWESPNSGVDDGFYAWLAGEAAAIKQLRRLLVAGYGLDRTRVAFMGYWRQGQSERA